MPDTNTNKFAQETDIIAISVGANTEVHYYVSGVNENIGVLSLELIGNDKVLGSTYHQDNDYTIISRFNGEYDKELLKSEVVDRKTWSEYVNDKYL